MYTQIHTHTQQLKALLLWTGLVPGESLLSVRLNSWGGPPICLQLVPYCTRLYVLICRPTRHPIHTSYTHSLSERLLASVHIHSRFLTHTEFTIRFRAKHRETQSLQKKKMQCCHCKKYFLPQIQYPNILKSRYNYLRWKMTRDKKSCFLKSASKLSDF